MNLLEIRTKFVEITGRYDLVIDDTSFVDNGANFYITEGNKELYRDQDILPNNMEAWFTVPAGSIVLPIPNIITLESMYYIDSAGDKKYITTLTDMQFKATFPDARKGALLSKSVLTTVTADLTGSTITFTNFNPLAYGFLPGMKLELAGTTGLDGSYVLASRDATSITVEETFSGTETAQKIDLAGYFGDMGTPSYARYTGLNIVGQGIVQAGNIGIYFDTPFSTEVTLFVEGLFLDSLSDDTDESYWSLRAPMLLLAQSAWFLEMTYRNSTGMRDWDEAMLKMKEKIEAQFTELTTHEIDQMEEAY